MRPSLHLIFVGVGALIAFSNTAPGAAKPPSEQSQPPKPIPASERPSATPAPTVAESKPATLKSQWWSGADPRSPLVVPETIVPETIVPENRATARVDTPAAPEWLQPRASKISPPSVQTPVAQTPVVQIPITQTPATQTQPIGLLGGVDPIRSMIVQAPNRGRTIPDPTVPAINLPPIPLPPDLPPPGTVLPSEPDVAQPIGPAKPGRAPEYLNPDPNPLQFPTRSDEVRLRGIQPITLLQAVQLAERNSRTLQVSVQQFERSRAQLRQAQASYYPTVGFQSGITNSQSASGQLSQRAQAANSPFLNQTNQNQNSTSLSGSLGVNYDVFTFGLRPAQVRAAERQLRSDELQVEITREQLRLDVANDYYNLQEADESVRISRVSVRNFGIALRDAQALETAGLGTRFDSLQSEVRLANAYQQLTNSLSQQRIRRRQLAVRLAIPLTLDLASAEAVEVAGTWNLTLDDSVLLAVKNRAELEQLLVQREVSEQQRRVALLQLAPAVTFSAQYQFLNSFNDGFGIANGYSLTAGVQWNFFDGGAARARADQQTANIAIAEIQFADTRDQVRFQVEQAFFTLAASSENVGTTTSALERARQALRLAQLRFQAGVGTQLEVSDSVNNLTQAQSNRISAILSYNRALAQLQRAVTNLPPGSASPFPPVTSPATPLAPTSSNLLQQSLSVLSDSTALRRAGAAGLLQSPLNQRESPK